MKRGAILLASGSLLATFFISPGWVFGKYPNLAASLAEGTASAAQVGDASPAYLLLHLLVSPLFVRVVQAGAAALTVAILFHLLHRQGGAIAAWVGAGALAVSQQWLVYSAVMEPDLLIGAAIAVSILLLQGEGEGDASVQRLALAGLALGVAVSLRPTALLFAVLSWGWLVARKTSPRGLAAVAVATLVAGALPSLLLRAKVGHELSGTMSAGQVFHMSHRPESVGFGATFPALIKVVEAQAAATGPHPPDYAHELYRAVARLSDAKVVSVADAEVFWFSSAARFFRIEPVTALGQLLGKFVFFLVPPATEYDIPAVKPLLQRSGVPLRWIALLSFGCLLVSLGGTKRAASQLWALHWAASLMVALLFYFHGRYAVGFMPSLAALCGLGLARVWTEPRRRLLHLVLLVAPFSLLVLPTVRWADRMVERLSALETERKDEVGTWEAARDRYLDEQAAMPDVFWPTSPHGVGVGVDDPELARLAAARALARYGSESPVDATLAAALFASAGECEQALRLADGAAGSGFVWALGDRSIDPRIVASDCLVRLGRPAEALLRLEASNREHPGRLDTLARLVAAGDVGQPSDVERWEQELESLHDAASVRFALAGARRHWGDPEGALVDAEWLRDRWPEAVPFAEHERSLALLALQRPEAALAAWAKTLDVRAGLHEQALLSPLVAALTEGTEGAEGAASLAIVHWRKQGDRERVRALRIQFPRLNSP